MRPILITLLALNTAPGLAFADDREAMFCVKNASQHTHLFVTETREGTRAVEELAPGAQLCSAKTQAEDGVVSVFETPNALEGCGRIIGAGTTEVFFKYAEFDRCAWSSNAS